MPYVQPYTWLVGDVVTATEFNQTIGALGFGVGGVAGASDYLSALRRPAIVFQDLPGSAGATDYALPTSGAPWNRAVWQPQIATVREISRPEGSNNFYPDTASGKTGIVLNQTGWWHFGASMYLAGMTTAMALQWVLYLYIDGSPVAQTETNTKGLVSGSILISVSGYYKCSTVPTGTVNGNELSWGITCESAYAAGAPTALECYQYTSPVFWCHKVRDL